MFETAEFSSYASRSAETIEVSRDPMNTGLLSKRLQTEHLPKPAEIEQISRSIAKEKGNPEYYISPAAWSQIKRGTTPSIYKLFSLAVCLRMPYERVVQAFGVDLEQAGSNGFGPDRAELVRINLQELGFSFQLSLDTQFDTRRTNLLQPATINREHLPGPLLDRLNPSRYRYVLLGLDDDSMGDLIPPGSLVEIDPKQTMIESFAWRNVRERPVYGVRHGEDYSCTWCQQDGRELTLLPHPLSRLPVRRFALPQNAEVIGRAVSVWFFQPLTRI